MNGFAPFLKKEFTESKRTYRAAIMLIVMLFFGIIGPLAAKFLPQMLEMLMPDNISAEDMGVLNLFMRDPSALDAWAQYFNNMSQIGIMMIAIMFSGALASEAGKGTLIPLLARGLSRPAAVVAKFVCQASLWTLFYAAAAAVTWGLTSALFPAQGYLTPQLFFSHFGLWLFGIFVLALTLFMSAILKNVIMVLLSMVGSWFVMAVVTSVYPSSARYNPLTLSTSATNIAATNQPGFYLPAVLITAALAAASLLAAVFAFKKRAL
ncbi:MAG: ABC transporter permease [Oscillospiraceae bacterium]|jgi:ABC-2 type transport system permease protein|nr:ABC transporter permease [Oscillospiraceae bacterium]